MKYLSVLFLILLLKWSWCAIRDSASPSHQTHQTIQVELVEFVTTYVQSQIPSASRIEFRNLWTENILDGKIKAHFEYSFDQIDGSTESTRLSLRGSAVLTPMKDPQSGTNSWSLDRVEIDREVVDFQNETLIVPDSRK